MENLYASHIVTKIMIHVFLPDQIYLNQCHPQTMVSSTGVHTAFRSIIDYAGTRNNHIHRFERQPSRL